AELGQAGQRIEPLVQAAQSSLDRLYLAVGGVGCCVLLADRDGVPVERRGAPVDDETFRSWGLWTGSVWNEESQGTNGIGTCLVERRALTIHRDQHFHTRNTLLSCTTAPIHDHEGNLVAALDVSSCRADLTEAFANLISMAVVDAVRRIEGENF
ncbi:sigma-54-dependent Fis family transcriptional regulator, partial [Mesorhizobium sp. M2D.F.Ca.ET.160.01.1.1]